MDNVAKTVFAELRELRSDIARNAGKSTGELEVARAEVERSKVQIDALRVEIERLRTELDKTNTSLVKVSRRFGRLQTVG